MVADEFNDGDEVLFEGAQCCRCDLDLDPRTGFCPNDRCPYHGRYQDEVVRWSPPNENEEAHIEEIRAKFRGHGG